MFNHPSHPGIPFQAFFKHWAPFSYIHSGEEEKGPSLFRLFQPWKFLKHLTVKCILVFLSYFLKLIMMGRGDLIFTKPNEGEPLLLMLNSKAKHILPHWRVLEGKLANTHLCPSSCSLGPTAQTSESPGVSRAGVRPLLTPSLQFNLIV